MKTKTIIFGCFSATFLFFSCKKPQTNELNYANDELLSFEGKFTNEIIEGSSTSYGSYYLETDDKTYTLDPVLASSLNENIKFGKRIKIRGSVANNKLKFNRNDVTVLADQTTEETVSRGRGSTILLVLLDSAYNSLDPSTPVTIPESDLDYEDYYFNTNTSIPAFYTTVTRGKINYTGEVVRINYHGNINVRYQLFDVVGTVANKADSILGELGYNLRGYDHILYAAKYDAGWSGVANIGGKKALIKATTYNWGGKRTACHEIGHNLNMNHSSTTQYCEYCDPTCTMGNLGYYNFNAPHMIQKNWLPKSNVASVKGNGGNYNLTPLDYHTSGNQVVRIGQNVFVSCRDVYNAPFPTPSTNNIIPTNKVYIHYHAGGTENTQILAELLPGESYNDVLNNYTIINTTNGSNVSVAVNKN